VVAALELGRTSWTEVLDAVRLELWVRDSEHLSHVFRPRA
jgi:hypothetical protein